MNTLKIYYTAKEKVNLEFDKEIDKLAKKHGLEMLGSGFDMTNKIRDLRFKKK